MDNNRIYFMNVEDGSITDCVENAIWWYKMGYEVRVLEDF